MFIKVNETHQQFHISNGRVSYIFHVMKNKQLGHLYFGKALRHRDDFSHLQTYDVPTAASCHPYADDPAFSLETIRQEFPVYGNSDFREPAVAIRTIKAVHVPCFEYVSYRVIEGKPKLEGLPATYADDSEAITLEVTLRDDFLQAEILLHYTIFCEIDVLTRSTVIRNVGQQELQVDRIMSAVLDLPDQQYEMVHLAGAWSRERLIKERPLETGIQSISSLRGASSHHHNPFLMLKRKDATEQTGEVLGFQFVYSSNFLMQVEVDHYGSSRVSIGIHPFQFQWQLKPGGSFQTPEVIIGYSTAGMNGLSQTLHQLSREHVIPKQWREVERPILINNWEATYFTFNEKKLLDIAEAAQDLGVELFVLDDGWFGKRNDDTSSLGDWFDDRNKLPDGVDALARKMNERGLKFGLWFEPEMVSPNSELFREHPDWAVGDMEQPRTLGRNQFVLDFSRDDVVDYIYEQMCSIINRTQLSYIKWDMNRNMTEAFSSLLPVERQGEFFHRYILGVYRLYEQLTKRYPNVLFESCAGGGGRFDLGMLYYAPQAWASDDTDAVERLKIQYGSSLVYPVYSIGSHVSAVPNHQTLRTTSLAMRANTAYFGTFGYELNPLLLSEQEKQEVKEQIQFYKKHRALLREGDFYRLLSPFEGNETAWMVVSKNKKEALVGWYKVLATPNDCKHKTLRLQGLLENSLYQVSGEIDREFYGDELMQVGIKLPTEFNGVNGRTAKRGGDFQSVVYYINAKLSKY